MPLISIEAMINVIHSFEKDKISKESKDSCFFLSNNIGGYISLSNCPISKYEGMFFNKNFQMFKTINNIELLDCNKITKITNKFNRIERHYSDRKECFIMPNKKDGLIYSLSKKSKVKISLDCRKIFDLREWGRYYKTYPEKDMIIVEYCKKDDEREINTLGEYKLYIAIISDSKDFEKIERWVEEKYKYDNLRENNSNFRYVYDTLTLNCKKIIFGVGITKKDAIFQARNTAKEKKLIKPKIKRKIIIEKDLDFAYLCSQNSLNNLVQIIKKQSGIYAGFWWFTQYWTRDIGVSLKALILKKEDLLVKNILKNYFNKMKNGEILNRLPESKLKSLDGSGWIFTRLDDFISELEEEQELLSYLNKKELLLFKNKLLEYIEYSAKNTLVTNSKKETWMDTSGNTEDTRSGERIEIQALQLRSYKLLKKLSELTKDKKNLKRAEDLEKALKKEVIKHFWNGEYLKDGKNDNTIRPNIFLAYYLYPKLLTNEEWIRCFDNILPKLWCDWGGITSIDKSNPLYQPFHTGENDLSYHRGDSWYWINNIAAICMYRLNNVKYSNYIKKITDASAKEILWSGCIGGHSEISSADKQESLGCLNQAWSNSTFVELIEELFK